MKRAARHAILVALGSACIGACSRGGSDPARRPNLLLVTIESLRADHVGCLGYARPTTPSLDQLARESTLYPNAFSVTSWTLTSHASIFTGLYPSAHRVIEPRDRLSEAATTLAELLRDAKVAGGRGWQTAGLASGPYLTKPFNLQQGFELYDDSLSPDFEHIDDAPTNPKIEAAARRFFASERDASRPFFLFVYCWDPHYSYLPPPPFNSLFVPAGATKIDLGHYDTNDRIRATMPKGELDYVVSQYDGEVRATDEMLGRLFQLLRDQGVWDDTAVIVTADHGEEFFEHGQKGHKRNLYRESLHVPLWIKAPHQREAKRDDRVVSGVDLLPTALELCGVEYDGPVHGRSLLGPPDDERPTFHELVTTWYFGQPGATTKRSDIWSAVRKGDRELFTIEFHDGRKEKRLYDLSRDAEQRNKLDAAVDCADLERRLADFHRDCARLGDKLQSERNAQLSPADEQRLRAAGYLQSEENH